MEPVFLQITYVFAKPVEVILHAEHGMDPNRTRCAKECPTPIQGFACGTGDG